MNDTQGDSKLERIRHSTAHLLAQAVQELWPGTRLGVGPVIENGFYYDFERKEPFTPEDLEKIEQKMKEIAKRNLRIEKVELSKAEQDALLKKEPYKKEIVHDIKKRGEQATFYRQGEWVDLCRGPHVDYTARLKAFKLLKVSGAYWKGDAKNPQLQRIYGTSWENKEDLEKYMKMLEEAEKRNHVKLGKALGLFSFHQEGPGFPFWHAKGTLIFNKLLDFIREENTKRNYEEIKTPILLNDELWHKSGHWDNFKENMYFTKLDDTSFAVKPMSCPGGLLIYKEALHSYRELPLKRAEFGLVHRHELSGVLNGLFRVRSFTQDDAHVFCTKEQVEREVTEIIDYTLQVYKTFGFNNFEMFVATRPEKYIGSDEDWTKATKDLENALRKKDLAFGIKEGEGAFYGPKIEFNVKDSLGRNWQLGTVQIDFSMPLRFEATYEGSDGKKHVPVMVHRAILGSFERFIGILIEHFAGNFPLWIAPIQVRLMTVNDRNIEFAEKVMKEMKEAGLRVELDKRTETIPKKVRDAQVDKIPHMVTIGDKEVEKKTLAVRTLNGEVKFGVSVQEFIRELKEKVEKKE